MKEIKFRAWQIDWKGEGGKMMYIKPEDFSWLGETALVQTTRYIVMQYTGLLDKNGKEIYEGDIVKSLDGRLSAIEYDAPHFIVRHIPENGSDFPAVKNHFEIIGNIYENPELLK